MLEYLSEEAKKGLLYIDSLDASERKQFLAAVVSSATRTKAPGDLPECPTDEHTSLQNALLTLYTIAVKHSVSSENLRTFLRENLDIKEESVVELLEGYESCREEIRRRLARHGHDIPWATNITCKLASARAADLLYKVTFEGYPANGDESTAITKFDCTLEELQHLTFQLKEIERNCQRIADGK